MSGPVMGPAVGAGEGTAPSDVPRETFCDLERIAMYCTTSDVGRPVGPWSEGWEFIVDGVTVGHVLSMSSHGTDAYAEDGYQGLLYGPGGRDDVAAFHSRTLPFRQAVVEQLIRQVIVRRARALGLTVDPEDIGDVATGYPTLDGMPADQWLAAQSMD